MQLRDIYNQHTKSNIIRYDIFECPLFQKLVEFRLSAKNLDIDNDYFKELLTSGVQSKYFALRVLDIVNANEIKTELLGLLIDEISMCNNHFSLSRHSAANLSRIFGYATVAASILDKILIYSANEYRLGCYLELLRLVPTNMFARQNGNIDSAKYFWKDNMFERDYFVVQPKSKYALEFDAITKRKQEVLSTTLSKYSEGHRISRMIKASLAT